MVLHILLSFTKAFHIGNIKLFIKADSLLYHFIAFCKEFIIVLCNIITNEYIREALKAMDNANNTSLELRKELELLHVCSKL